MKFVLLKDTLTPELNRLLIGVRKPRPIFVAGARATRGAILDHLRRLQSQGNEHKWPDRYFFMGKANSVATHVNISTITDQTAVVTIDDPRLLHRIKGGPVRPRRVRNLAIPLTAEAYRVSGQGRISDLMPDLELNFNGRHLYLGRKKVIRERGKKIEKWTRLFLLLPGVNHTPRPQEAPDREIMKAAAFKAMSKAAKALLHAGE